MAMTTSEAVSPKPKVSDDTPAVEEQVKPSSDSSKVTLVLQHQYTNIRSQAEGGNMVFGPGEVTVEKHIAEDLMRRERAYLQSENDRINGMDRTDGHVAHLG